MNKTFAVIGAGMQGTAAAYDLVRYGKPAAVLLGDMSLEQATKSADRVNLLTGAATCKPVQVDALDKDSLTQFLEPADVLLSCVPYWMHPKIAEVAIETGTSMLDLGGNTEITLETLAMNDKAKAAAVTLVPDTGLAPGLVNSIGLSLFERLDTTDSVKLYCGVLPQNPKPPFNYKLTFNVEGLLTEYDFQAVVLRDGEIVLVDTLDELEELHIEELGKMEAFTTSGGTSTAPYTLQGKIPNYEYKTIRFPGHCERIRIFRDFGFWGTDPVQVDGESVIPRHLFYKVFGDALAKFEDLDLCAVRGVGVGTKDGEKVRLQVDIFDKQCETTGFTSMERLTGFSMSIYAIELANGGMETGCLRYESAMSGGKFLTELEKRGIKLKYSEEKLSPTNGKVLS